MNTGLLFSLATVFFLGMGGKAVAGTAVDFGTEKTYTANNDIGEPCTVMQNDYYKLYYPAALPGDGKLMNSYMKNAVTAMITEFSTYKPESLLKDNMTCTVYVYDKPNGRASEVMAQTISGDENDKFFATMHFLAPSKYSSTAKSTSGLPKDGKYLTYLTVHEYSTIIINRLTVNKEYGWSMYESPIWFNQGYEQYLGLKYSPIAKETFGIYLAKLKRNPNRVHAFSYGISVENHYDDGALMLKFMNEVFGEKRVQALLVSTKPTFYEALEDVIGTKDGFMREWDKWLLAQ